MWDGGEVSALRLEARSSKTSKAPINGFIMDFPVVVQSWDGQFAASLVGDPDVRAVAESREAALAGLESAIVKRVAKGELLTLSIGTKSLSDLAGTYRDDPFLQEICDEIYR